MVAILEQPEDIVAFIHESAEVVLCIACDKDEKERVWHILPNLIVTPILARNCGIHEKCDRCHGTFLTTEF